MSARIRAGLGSARNFVSHSCSARDEAGVKPSMSPDGAIVVGVAGTAAIAASETTRGREMSRIETVVAVGLVLQNGFVAEYTDARVHVR
jgi:hypothetical protein